MHRKVKYVDLKIVFMKYLNPHSPIQNQISYHIQEEGPSYDLFHYVLCSKFLVIVGSERGKEVGPGYRQDTSKERQNVSL